MFTPLLEKVGLRPEPATVVAGMAEASITPLNPFAEVFELPAFSAVCMAWKLEDPAPSGDTVATVGRIAAASISVEVGKLDSAVSPEALTIDVVEEPTTAT